MLVHVVQRLGHQQGHLQGEGQPQPPLLADPRVERLAPQVATML